MRSTRFQYLFLEIISINDGYKLSCTETQTILFIIILSIEREDTQPDKSHPRLRLVLGELRHKKKATVPTFFIGELSHGRVDRIGFNDWVATCFEAMSKKAKENE